MPANYGTITHTQKALVANTVSGAIEIPNSRSPSTRIVIAGVDKTVPVYFLIRTVGSSTQPTTVAAGASGSGSPCALPGVPVEISQIPSGTVELVLKATANTDAIVIIYEESL